MTYRGHLIGGIGAAGATTLVAPELTPVMSVGIAMALLGSLAPDLDHHGSYLSRRMGPIPYLLKMFISNPISWILLGLLRPGKVPRGKSGVGAVWHKIKDGRKRMKSLVAHRALSHSLMGFFMALVLVSAMVGAIWYVWPSEFAQAVSLLGKGESDFLKFVTWSATLEAAVVWVLGFALGYLSHIVLDMMTVSGVPLLLPATKKRYWVLPKSLRVTTR